MGWWSGVYSPVQNGLVVRGMESPSKWVGGPVYGVPLRMGWWSGEQYKEGDGEVHRGNAWNTTSESGLALNGTAYCGKLKAARRGGSWL